MEYMAKGVIYDLEQLKDDAKVKIMIYDENLEQQIVDIDDLMTCSQGDMIIDISETIANILQERDDLIFRRCLSNTPKHLQTKETINLLKDMFGYK